jgi:hypothetical protein
MVVVGHQKYRFECIAVPYFKQSAVVANGCSYHSCCSWIVPIHSCDKVDPVYPIISITRIQCEASRWSRKHPLSSAIEFHCSGITNCAPSMANRAVQTRWWANLQGSRKCTFHAFYHIQTKMKRHCCMVIKTPKDSKICSLAFCCMPFWLVTFEGSVLSSNIP